MLKNELEKSVKCVEHKKMRCFKEIESKKLLYLIVLIISIQITNATILNDSTSSDFLNGTFNNTTFVNLSVQLNQSLSGTFTSRIFDPNRYFSAINISMNFTSPQERSMFLVDIAADIWKSQDKGVTWKLLEDDYNDDSNNPKSMTSDNNYYFYIVEADDDIWRSSNLGVSWNKVNDNYDHVPSSNGVALFIMSDLDDSLYIIEKDEDIWRSNNLGVNWTRVNHLDFNKKNGDVTGTSVIYTKPYLADKNSDIWISDNKGVTWILVKDDYNGAESNNIISMSNDNNNYLYTVESDDNIWSSTNLGISWQKVNTNYDGLSLNNGNALILTSDNDNSLYIIEKDEDIWRSNNLGVNWTKVNGTNFNGNNDDVKGSSRFLGITNFRYQIRYHNLTNWSEFIGPNNNANLFFSNNTSQLDLQNVRYLQYKTFFDSDSIYVSPLLFNTNIIIEEDLKSPSINLYNPQNITFNSTLILINFSATDNFNVGSLWFSNGSLNVTYSSPVVINITEGSHNFNFYANDTSGNINFTHMSFTIDLPDQDIIPPNLDFISPQNATYNSSSILINISNSNDTYSIWWFNETQNISYSSPINYNFTNGSHKILAFANDSYGNTNSTSIDFTISELLVDLTPPSINLMSPENLYTDTDGTISFSYNVSDEYPISNCSLLINSQLIQTNNNIDNNAQNNFNANLTYGLFNWSVKCTDTYNNFNSSSLRYIRVILISNFDGNTTNLTNLNLSNISDFTIENLNYAKIKFLQPVNLENGADINSNVNLSRYSITLNSGNLLMLNVTAEISMYNVNDTNVTILMNNQICPSNICTNIDLSNNIYAFRVTHFTSFSLNASFQVAASNETTTPPQSSGGGSGGGGGGRTTTISKNTEPEPNKEESKPKTENPETPNNDESEATEGTSNNNEIQQSPTRFRFPLWAMVSIVAFLVLLTVYEIFIIKRRRNKKEKVISKNNEEDK